MLITCPNVWLGCVLGIHQDVGTTEKLSCCSSVDMASIFLRQVEFGDERKEKFAVQGLYHYNTGRGIYNTNTKGHLPNELNLESEQKLSQLLQHSV